MYPMEHIWTIVMLEICKHTFYAYLSRIWKMMQFMGFIRKVFATKILLSGKFSPFLTLSLCRNIYLWFCLTSTLIVGLKTFVNLRCLLFSLGIPGFCGRWQFFSLHLLLILFKEIPSLHGCSDGPSRSTAVHNPGKISSLEFCERYLTVILNRAIQFWLLFVPSSLFWEGSSSFLFCERQPCAGHPKI